MSIADVIADQEENLQLVDSAKRGKGRPKLRRAMTGEELFEKVQGHILFGRRMEALRKVKRVFDFLPAGNIKKNSLREVEILNTWTSFFANKEVPFIVVEDGENRVLWKEKYVEE